MSGDDLFVHDFREAAPYIDYLRGKTLVIGVASNLVSGQPLAALATDLTLLASLGVHLVLIHGSRQQISELSNAAGHEPEYHNGRRITDNATLTLAKQACGLVRFNIEAALSVGIAHSPQRGKYLRIASGNYVSARPLGVSNGIDMGYTGRVRKVDSEAIQQRLDDGALVLISPLGHSLSGKTFNLSMADLAEAVAISLKAEKLIFIINQEGILDEKDALISNLSAKEAQQRIENDSVHVAQRRILKAAINAVENDVQRTHVLSGLQDGGIIRELFTRNGVGTSVAKAPFMNIRQAHSGDIPDIMSLIRPLEDEGILLPRSREYLDSHIHEFSVLEHDRQIYGCVALKIFTESKAAELACLVVAKHAQDGGYGKLLLEYVLNEAQKHGLDMLFALSTQTGEWFLERNFQSAEVAQLPLGRQQEYHDSGRCSKIFMLPLG